MEKMIDFGKDGVARVIVTTQTGASPEEIERNRRGIRRAVSNLFSNVYGGVWKCTTDFDKHKNSEFE